MNESPRLPGPTSIGQRLRLEMRKRGVTSALLARQAGVKTSFIYDVISGKSANPSTVKLARVAESLGVSLTSLVGNGSLSSGQPGESSDYVSVPQIKVDRLAGRDSLVTAHEETSWCRLRRDWISQALGARPHDVRHLILRGDSMAPTLLDGDTVLIDQARRTPSPPGLYAVFDGYELVVKRLEYLAPQSRGRLRISSDNPAYAAYECPLDDLSIIGRVVWLARSL